MELLKTYNLSLTQTLLFDSTELKFTVPGNWQQIFFNIKRLGLIYEVFQLESFWVKIDGPASLFKLTRKYGTSIAKLIPVIMANSEWRIEAKILWKFTNEICNFRIESSKQGSILKSPKPSAITFDSTVEADFSRRFQALKSGWSLVREPEPILAGNQVIIPDFSLEREGVKIYLEIMGYWTEEYLSRKIDKLSKIDVKMILMVNEALACEKLTRLGKQGRVDVIYYRDEIPLAPLLSYLGKVSKETNMKQVASLRDLTITFTEPIVKFADFAAQIGISVEAAKEALTADLQAGYVATPSSLVSKVKLEEIRTQIVDRANQPKKFTLPEATTIIEDLGTADTVTILNLLGFKITWHGIDPEQAEVSKINNETDTKCS